jgi:hypothetical protein
MNCSIFCHLSINGMQFFTSFLLAIAIYPKSIVDKIWVTLSYPTFSLTMRFLCLFRFISYSIWFLSLFFLKKYLRPFIFLFVILYSSFSFVHQEFVLSMALGEFRICSVLLNSILLI